MSIDRSKFKSSVSLNKLSDEDLAKEIIHNPTATTYKAVANRFSEQKERTVSTREAKEIVDKILDRKQTPN